MKRVTVNFIVDLCGFLSLIALAITGSIMRWVLPPGSGGGGGGGGGGHGFRGGRGPVEVKLLAGLSRHEWGSIHFWIAVAFIVLMVIHIILHWTWIKCYVAGLFRGRKASLTSEGGQRVEIDEDTGG
jgi:hypothetical protein